MLYSSKKNQNKGIG